MPEAKIIFYLENDNTVPVLDWLDSLPEKIQDKFVVRVERLAACGHELRRPEAAFLRDGIYELRVRRLRVNYRVLYFFSRQCAVLSHGTTKDDKVPEKDIELAMRRLHQFEANALKHTYVVYDG